MQHTQVSGQWIIESFKISRVQLEFNWKLLIKINTQCSVNRKASDIKYSQACLIRSPKGYKLLNLLSRWLHKECYFVCKIIKFAGLKRWPYNTVTWLERFNFIIKHCIAAMFGSRKVWWIWQISRASSKFNQPNFRWLKSTFFRQLGTFGNSPNINLTKHSHYTVIIAQ